MATSQKTTQQGFSRRGFIAACGAAVAASALPKAVLGAPRRDDSCGRETLARWQEAQLPGLRALYLAEVVRFAEEIRPRFESGEFRGFTDADSERIERERDWDPPLFELENLCEQRFRLDVDRYGEEAYLNAYLIRCVSPSEGQTFDAQPIAGQAAIAVSRDVLAVARARGFCASTPDEDPSLDETRWAEELTDTLFDPA
jgi:hypothetical protein